MKKGKKFWAFKALGDKTAELTLYGEISNETWWGDEVTPKQFKEELDSLGEIENLNVFINSPGGDVFAGQAIYSMLKRHPANVIVFVDGLAASIASLVAMAGDKVIMPKNAMMMIHSPWTLAIGNAQDFRKVADDLDKIEESIIVAYESRCSLSRDEIIALLDAETWLSADDCLELGFADETEEAKQIAACLTKEMLSRYKNIPKDLIAEPKSGEDLELKKKIMLLELELV